MRPNQLVMFCTMSLLLVMTACKKDDKEPSRTDILTTGKWRITAFTMSPPYDYDADGVVDGDVYASLETCEKDNYFIFKTNGKLELNEGPSKCYPSDPQIEEQNWAFSNDEKEIIIDGERCIIQELTPSKFRLLLTIFPSVAEVTFTR